MVARRLTFVLDDLRLGGAERVTLRWARWFASQGVDVELVTLKGGGPLETEVGSDVKWRRLGVHRVIHAVPALSSYLRERRPEVVVATLPHVNVATAMAVALSGQRPRLVLREANDPRAEHPFRGRAGHFRRRVVTWAYRRAHVVVALTQGNARGLKEHLRVDERRIRVIPNPIERLPEGAAPPVDAPGGRPRLLCVARLVPQKDHATLIEAFAILGDLPDASLVLVGDGRLRSELETLAQARGVAERLVWTGQIMNVAPWWAWADVMVLPSRWEGFPNVLLEALAHGVQVVATDCPSGPMEILDQGRFGFLAPVGQPGALAEAIRLAVRQPRPRSELLARAQDFDIATVGRQWIEAFGWETVGGIGL